MSAGLHWREKKTFLGESIQTKKEWKGWISFSEKSSFWQAEMVDSVKNGGFSDFSRKIKWDIYVCVVLF